MGASAQEYREVVLALPPEQGGWGEDAYRWLTDRGTRLIELNDGFLEVPPMPSDEQQLLLKLLVRRFDAPIEAHGGIVLFAPLRLRLRDGRIREPDLPPLLARRDPRRQSRYWSGADLVLEIVSPDDPARDLVTKRREYAEAGLPEYWIVEPRRRQITVLTLRDGSYVEHGTFRPGSQATSPLLAGILRGFALDITALFASL